MTDQLMDARLSAAGEAWRTAVEPTSGVATGEPVDVLANHARRPRRLAWLASAAVLAAALVAGGVYALQGSGEPSATGAAPLRGTVWRLIASGGHSAPDSLATLSIDEDGALVADDGCTLFGAHVDLDHGQLFPSKFDIRDRDCAKQPGPVSFAGLVDTLTHFPAYSLTDDRLTIGSLRFVAAPLPAPTLDVPTFAGAIWRLVRATDARGHATAVTDGPTLRLKDGQLAVGDGCNTLTGPAYVDGRRVEWKQLVSGLVLCAGIQSVVDAIFRGTSAEQRIDGTKLTISNAGGTLTYQWVPSDKAATDPQSFVGHDWDLVSIAGTNVSPPLQMYAGGVSTALSFEDGCGWNGGTPDITAGALRMTGLRTTPITSCGQSAVEREVAIDSYFRADPALWAIRKGELVIYGPGPQGNSLVYRRPGAPPPSTPTADAAPEILTGTWKLTSIETSAAKSASGRSVQFADTLRYLGRQGMTLREPCQEFLLPVTLDQGIVTFGARRGIGPIFHCGPDTAELHQETAAVDRVVNGAVHWSISSGVLTLSKGGTTLTFTR